MCRVIVLYDGGATTIVYAPALLDTIMILYIVVVGEAGSRGHSSYKAVACSITILLL